MIKAGQMYLGSGQPKVELILLTSDASSEGVVTVIKNWDDKGAFGRFAMVTWPLYLFRYGVDHKNWILVSEMERNGE